MNYDVVFKPKVRKGLVRLPEPVYERFSRAITDLAADPRPCGARKMRGTGKQEEWRVRVGDYRIVYRVDDKAREVLVLAVGHRGSVYG